MLEQVVYAGWLSESASKGANVSEEEMRMLWAQDMIKEEVIEMLMEQQQEAQR